jgi:ankyrin repeat protein
MASLHKAVADGDIEKVRQLLGKRRFRESVSSWRNIDGLCSTPLHLCTMNLEMTQLLLDQGADANAHIAGGGECDYSPLHMAATNGDEDVAEALLEHGAEVNLPDRYGRTPLWSASLLGWTYMAELLLERGAQVNVPDIKGVTPFACAKDEGMKALLASHGGQP